MCIHVCIPNPKKSYLVRYSIYTNGGTGPMTIYIDKEEKRSDLIKR